ncbi:MAG: F0F1 ATP synthase subunit A [Bacteroidales bacterium]|nr:F0F1 ATP synthase subunit A [Bacteroidales bacterium]
MCLLISLPSFAKAESEPKEEFKAGEVIIEHVLDSYDWHLFSWKGHHVSIYLPIIVFNEGRCYTFSSKVFHHDGKYVTVNKTNSEELVFVIPHDGKYKGKVVILNADGSQKRPFDISITKNVMALFISCAVIIVLFLLVAKAYRKRGEKAPKGLQSLFEMLIVYVRDDIARKAINEKSVDKYLPYLITVFFFIFINNLVGLIPIFPFGANITGNITVTAVLAIFTFLITNLLGNKEYYKDIVNTPGVPWFLKFPLPLMPIIETVGCFTKPFVLAIRLFANITAGHIVVLGFISSVFIVAQISAAGGVGMSIFSLILVIFVDCIELLVAYVQAYVFTLLSALYFGMASKEHHH